MRNSTMQILRATLAVLALAGGGLLVTQALGQGTAAQGVGAEARISVITHHYDSLRSGWNQRETRLTASKFPASFGVIQSVALDDQVDAQPLIVPGETIAGGIHDVVYVVTENNSVYAIDANSGAILLHRNLGPPVPTPLGCGNNGPNVGITGTPVIDLSLGEIFVIAYINGSPPSYQLHALNLTTLADQLPPVTVAASQTLTDGSKFAFDATYQRQRPGLLEMNGTIYAGFGSFCDFDANLSRGWVLGWHSANLEPLAHAELNNSQASSPTDFFLSSVWMSGSGLAGEGDKVFFSTGNSDCNFYDNPEFCPSQSTYNGVTNIQESVINVNRTLSTRLGVFTPSNVYAMDVADADLGAAGVMIIAGDGGTSLATIVSKDGRLWLLDASNLSTILDMQQLGSGCWCAPTFFRGSDGISRVLSSAGNALQSWQIQGTSTPQLAPEATAYVQNGIQDPGFFTVVSSNGRKSGSAIIWAVARPTLEHAADPVCLRRHAGQQHFYPAIFLASRPVAVSGRQCQHRAGGCEWQGLCGLVPGADDLRAQWIARAGECIGADCGRGGAAPRDHAARYRPAAVVERHGSDLVDPYRPDAANRRCGGCREQAGGDAHRGPCLHRARQLSC